MDVLRWLKDSGYNYTWSVKLGGRTPDIIAFNEKEVIAFEIKRVSSELTTAVGQCLHYLKEANKVYTVLPRKESKNLTKFSLEIFKKNGIGLIVVNNYVKILLEAKTFIHDNKALLEKLKQKSVFTPLTANNFKENIVKILDEHPEGLTSTDIAKLLGSHRHTIAKYIFQLIGEGKIYQRTVGPAKLCYLKRMKK